MLPSAFLHQLITAPDYAGEMVHVEQIPASEAVLGSPNTELSQKLLKRLRARGVAGLYRHQANAIDLVMGGAHVVVNSPSASGKSLCYQIPTLHTLVNEPAATALYMFPTKALYSKI